MAIPYSSKAFDEGNYASAYEIEYLHEGHLESRIAELPKKEQKAFRNGFLLGFFSSYEDYEIPEEWRDEVVTLRKEQDNEDEI